MVVALATRRRPVVKGKKSAKQLMRTRPGTYTLRVSEHS